MGIVQAIRGGFVSLLIERPVARTTPAELGDMLDQGGQAIAERIDRMEGTSANRQTLRHIIGIERWGQRRLAVAGGQPFIRDEHDGYLPTETDWPGLQTAFLRTRAETAAMVRQMPPDLLTEQVVHNDLGPVTIRGWIRYLVLHARLESLKIRG